MPLEEQENCGFGPIFKKRSKAREIFFASIYFVIFFILVFFILEGEPTSKLKEILLVLSASVVTTFVGEHCRRLCLFTVECGHINTRYKGSYIKVAKAVFSFPPSVRSGVYVSTGLCFLLVIQELKTPWSTLLVNALLISLFQQLIGIRTFTQSEISQVSEEQKNNIAEGLVWAHYFGYLQYVLPTFIKQLGKSTEFRDKISLKKVLILIPRDCLIPPKLDEADKRIQKVGILPELTLQLQGFPRKFIHTVYKISDEGDYISGSTEPVYFVAEWPPILHRLYEMNYNSEAGLSPEDKDIQAMLFYRRLLDVLMNHAPHCRGTFCLIPYAGEGSDLVQIITEAIQNENNNPILN